MLTHADYVLFIQGYLAASGYRGLCADYDDSGSLTLADRVLFINDLETCNGPATAVCLADINLDFALTPADFGAFQAAVYNNDLRADINLDAQITPDDYSAFVEAFGAGCN